MRILYLSHYFPPEFGAAASRAHSMTRWLARFGHEVTVLTSLPNYLLHEVPAPYRGQKWMREEVDGVTVYRAWLYTSAKRKAWRRMANYTSFATSAWWHGRKLKGPFDVVIATSPPLFLGPAGVKLAQHFDASLVFDVRDLWPEIGVQLGAFRQHSLMYRSWDAIASYTYRHAGAIVPVTRGIRNDLVARGLPPDVIHLIPNGVDLAMIEEKAPDLRSELGLLEKFVVLFAGLIGVMQGVEVIVEAAALLRDRPDIHFLIAGDGVRRQAVAARMAALKTDNVTLLPRQPRERVPNVLTTSDICLATLANTQVKGVIPSKMLEAWAYRRPVIITDKDEGGQLAQSCQAGLATPPGDAHALADAVLKLEADRELARRMGENGRRCIEQKLNRESLARQMEAVLMDVVSASGRQSA